jgi:hypothetical protein
MDVRKYFLGIIPNLDVDDNWGRRAASICVGASSAEEDV